MKKEKALATRLDRVDAAITRWMAGHGVTLLRVAMGIVFFWFGALKFFPGVSPAERGRPDRRNPHARMGPSLQSEALQRSPSGNASSGSGFLSGKFLRVTILLLFLRCRARCCRCSSFPMKRSVKCR
jgi:hypothetical protein